MVRFVALIGLLVGTEGWAQADPSLEVRSALEEKAPLPSERLRLPSGKDLEPGLPPPASQTGRNQAAEAAAAGARAWALTRLPEVADPRASLRSAGQAAQGQARAEEAKKNSRANKPPRPVP